MNVPFVLLVSSMVIHAYIQQKLSGDWQLIVSEGNRLPVIRSTHYSRYDAKKEAALIGASHVMIVAPEVDANKKTR